jgi:hypothetical protein
MKTEHQRPNSPDLGLTIFLAKQRAKFSHDPKALAFLEELEPVLLKEAEKLAGKKPKTEYVDWGSVALSESVGGSIRRRRASKLQPRGRQGRRASDQLKNIRKQRPT